jgi:hypothetical protein
MSCTVSFCRAFQYPNQGSPLSFASRFGTVSTVKLAGFSEVRSSSHVIGVLTGAPARARVEYAAIDVFVRLFLK